MKDFITKITKLVDVKSIVTLVLTGSFVAQVATHSISKEFMVIYTMIMGFYFGTQAAKSS